jgi:hypothetical protein
MSSSRINRNQKFIGLQLGLGLLWLLVIPWLPSLPMAIRQAQNRRRWWVLLLSDLVVCAAAERAAHRCPAALPVVLSSWPSR